MFTDLITEEDVRTWLEHHREEVSYTEDIRDADCIWIGARHVYILLWTDPTDYVGRGVVFPLSPPE